MKHLDLFSGIGGFAYAIDQVWEDVEHTFCDNDKFCQAVLRKHWPESEIYGDIRRLKTRGKFDIVTGGFPCQPFSEAGRKRGTDDNRFLWPEMFKVIQATRPRWVVAENVRGIIDIQDGLVFEQVCLDLESAGYEVQPFIIPAAAVNAPHIRNRVWFVAHSERDGQPAGAGPGSPAAPIQQEPARPDNTLNAKGADSLRVDAADTNFARLQGREQSETPGKRTGSSRPAAERPFNEDWPQVAARLCRVDARVSDRVDRIKALGNAIVPQVAIQIMQAIKETSR